jgi:integrase/recombinase XerD
MTDRKRVLTAPWKLTRNMFLAEDEVERLLEAVRLVPQQASARQTALAARDRLLIETLLFSGLRNSELCGLRVEDTVLGSGQSVFRVHGTPRQDRTVYVPRTLSDLVQRFVREHRPHLVRSPTKGGPEPASLLVNDRGTPYDRTSLYRRAVVILLAAGLGERASVQRLRHTYGYLAYKRSGGNLLFIQRQMGHAHPMVSSVYAQFCEENYSEIADRVGRAADSSPSEGSPQRRNVRKKQRHVRSRRNS